MTSTISLAPSAAAAQLGVDWHRATAVHHGESMPGDEWNEVLFWQVVTQPALGDLRIQASDLAVGLILLLQGYGPMGEGHLRAFDGTPEDLVEDVLRALVHFLKWQRS